MKKKLFPVMIALAMAFALCTPAWCLADEGVADQSEYGGRVEVSTNGMKPVTADMMPEGTYGIHVDTDSGMFKVVKCQLTVQDGAMTAVLTLSGNGYSAIFMGTGAEALEADDSQIAQAQVEDGKYSYEVSVPVLNEGLSCCAFSKKKQKWYDHTIVFDASSLGVDVLPARVYAAPAPDDLFAVGARSTLDDGTYKMKVTLEGGSGRASIDSPCLVTVKDGRAVADIEWSSEFYDYMVVDGRQYLQTNTEGNSTFSIPIKWFDDPFPVVADTTRMSTPHEIEYTLSFEQDSASKVAAAGLTTTALIIIAVVALAVIAAIIALVMRRKKAKGVVAEAVTGTAVEAVAELAVDAVERAAEEKE